jgi:MFS family permease
VSLPRQCERVSASERAASNGLRGRGTQSWVSVYHANYRARTVEAPTGRELLADRSVRALLAASTTSSVAMFLQTAALGKHLFDITDSTIALGLLGLVEFLPALILLPLTGSVADRFDRRRVAAVGFAVEALTSTALCLYAATNPTSGIPLFLIAAVFGASRAFSSPAMRALPPLLAPDLGLPRLIALDAATWQFGMIVGPASSGFLYDIDPTVPYIAAAGCFALSVVLMARLRLRRPQQRIPADERPTIRHATDGLRFIRRTPVLLGAISLDLFAVLFGGAVALLPAIAEERLGVGNVGYGWLRAAPGIGAVTLTVLLAIRPVHRHVGVVLFGSVGVFGVATVFLGLTHSFAVAFVALLVLSGADAVSVFIRRTIVPLVTVDRMRGRVGAVENVFIGASNELGAFESGVAAALLGVGPAVVLGGLLTVGVVAVWPALFPALRRIDRFEEIAVDDPVVATT